MNFWRLNRTDAVLLALSGVLPALFAAAPPDRTEPGWFVVNAWGPKDGLPQMTILDLLQTRDGYLWVATKGGFARFDGVRFTVYDGRSKDQLRENEVRVLTETPDGSLWIGTFGGGVSRFQNGRLTTYTVRDGLINDFVIFMCHDAEGGIWIGTDGGVSRFHNGQFRNFTVEEGLPHEALNSLYADRDGSILMSSSRGGIVRFRDGKLHPETIAGLNPSLDVKAFCRDREQALWLATYDGLYRFKDGKTTRYATEDGLPSERITRLHEDGLGNLWIGTSGGLARYRDGRFDFYENVTDKIVTAITSDHEGCVWVNAEGLTCLRQGQFISYGMKEGLSYNNVNCILEGAAGAMWVGTSRELNLLQDGKFTAFGSGQGLAESVGTLGWDHDGHLWVGTESGMYRSRSALADGRSPDRMFVRVPDQPMLRPRVMYRDRKNALWIGANLEGLVRYQDGKFTVYTTRDGLAHNAVRGICEDPEGNLWVGTREGLNRFKDGRFTTFTEKDGLAHRTVQGLFLDRDHTLWIATRQGVNRFKDGRFTTYTANEGLLASFVNSFSEDTHGNLWMSTSQGIFRARKQQLEDFAAGRVQAIDTVIYGLEHGLSSLQAAAGFGNAACVARDGRIWFATTLGVSVVDPAKLFPNMRAPLVHVEEVRVDDRKLDLDRPAEAPPGRGNIVIRYTGLSFLAPEKVRFKYKLEGHDADWVDAGDRRSAFYNNIPPDRYTFRVQAANNDGMWNQTGASFSFALQPHWYQTWSFRVAAATLLLLLAMGAYQLRVRQLQQHRRKLEHRVAERTAQLQAANKELEAFSYSVSHDLRAPLRSIDGFSKAVLDEHGGKLDDNSRANLERVRLASQRMEGLIDDMLTLSTITRTEMNRATVDLSAMAQSIARELHATDPQRNVRFIIPPDLHARVDPNLIRIVLENLLNNAWKYTSKHPSARIELGVNQQNGQLIYFVRDDGAGFDMAFSQKLFGAFQRLHPAAQFQGTGIGLATVQRVIHRHGGRAWAEGAVEQGATFYFTISE